MTSKHYSQLISSELAMNSPFGLTPSQRCSRYNSLAMSSHEGTKQHTCCFCIWVCLPEMPVVWQPHPDPAGASSWLGPMSSFIHRLITSNQTRPSEWTGAICTHKSQPVTDTLGQPTKSQNNQFNRCTASLYFFPDPVIFSFTCFWQTKSLKGHNSLFDDYK